MNLMVKSDLSSSHSRLGGYLCRNHLLHIGKERERECLIWWLVPIWSGMGLIPTWLNSLSRRVTSRTEPRKWRETSQKMNLVWLSLSLQLWLISSNLQCKMTRISSIQSLTGHQDRGTLLSSLTSPNSLIAHLILSLSHSSMESRLVTIRTPVSFLLNR